MTERVDRKIVDLQALLAGVRAARASGRTIVHCHGCFDLVHPGHIRYLRFARQLGDVLVVSLTSDDGIDKGPDRPYIPQELRAENLAALEFVDWVVIDPHATAAELLETLRPDVYVKGREYAQMKDPRFLRESEIVERHGGRVVFHSGDVVFSSSRLLRARDRDDDLDECRLRTLCRRGGIDVTSVHAALERLTGLRALVVGDLIREHYISCDASEAAADAPVLDLQQLGVMSYWGGAAALALQLRALGAQATVVTAGVEGETCPAVETELAERGVAVHVLPARREPIERRTFVADDAKVLRLNQGGCHPLDSSWERRAQEVLCDRLARTDVLLWCDHGYGMVTPGLVRAVTTPARAAGLTIAGSAFGARGDIRALTDTDLLCLSERRLREALHDMGSSLPSVTWSLLSRARGAAAIVTLHKRGLIGFDGRDHKSAGARPDRAHASPLQRLRSDFVPALAAYYVDLLGAEEAVLALGALALASGSSLAMATYLAAGAEALTVSRPGRTAVTAGELQAWSGQRAELRAQCQFLPDAATPGDIARLAPPLTLPAPHGAAYVSAQR